MAINIFQNAEPAEGAKSQDIVGRFRSGRQLQNRPVSLSTWRVTTADPDVADAIAQTFGAIEGPQRWETQTDEVFEVITEVSEVAVILDGAKAVRSEMVLWGRKGKIRSCDGLTQTGDNAKGEPCVCPSDLEARIEGAKNGTACEPSVSYLFRLAELPDLGRFRFQTGSWTVARLVTAVEAALADIDGPAIAVLSLETRERKNGQTYTISVLNDIKPVEDAS